MTMGDPWGTGGSSEEGQEGNTPEALIHQSVVLRTMRFVEPADRIPFPICRGCDLPMVSFFPIWKSCGLGGM